MKSTCAGDPAGASPLVKIVIDDSNQEEVTVSPDTQTIVKDETVITFEAPGDKGP